MTVDFHSSFLLFGFLLYACFGNGRCKENSIDTKTTNTIPTIVEIVSVENTTSDISGPPRSVVYETIDDDSPNRVDLRLFRSHNRSGDGSSSTTNLPSIQTSTTASTTSNQHDPTIDNFSATPLEIAKIQKGPTKITKKISESNVVDHNRTVLLTARGKQKFHPIVGELVNSLDERAAVTHHSVTSTSGKTTAPVRQTAIGTDSDGMRATTQKRVHNNNVSRGQKSSPAFHYRGGGDGYEFETQFIADKNDDEDLRKFDKTRKYARGGDDPENNIDRIRNYNGNNINVKIGNVVKRPQGFSLTSTTTTSSSVETIENNSIIRKMLPKVTVRNGAFVAGQHHKLPNEENTSQRMLTISSPSSFPRDNEIVKKPSIKSIPPALALSSSSSPNRRKMNTSNVSGDNSLPTTSTAWALASLKTPLVSKAASGMQLKSSASSVEVSKRNNFRLYSTTGIDKSLTTMTTSPFAGTGTTIKPFIPWAVRLQKTTIEDQKDWTTTMRNLTDEVEAETETPNSLLENSSTTLGVIYRFLSSTTTIPTTLKSDIETIPHRANTLIDSTAIPTTISSSSLSSDQIKVRIDENFDRSYSESFASNASSNSNTTPDVDVKTFTQTAASHVTKLYDNFIKPTVAISTVTADNGKNRHQLDNNEASSTAVETGKHGVIVQIHDLGLSNADTLAPKFETESTAATLVEISTNRSQLSPNITTYSTHTVPQFPSRATTLRTDTYDEITRNLFGISSSTSQQHGNDIDYVHSLESTTSSSAVFKNTEKDSELGIISTSETTDEEPKFNNNNNTTNGFEGLEHIMRIGSSHEAAIKQQNPTEDITNKTYTSKEGSDVDEVTNTVSLNQDGDISTDNSVSYYNNAEQNMTMTQHNLKDNQTSEETVVNIDSSAENDHGQHKSNSSNSQTTRISATITPYIQSTTTNTTLLLKVQPMNELIHQDNVYLEVTTIIDASEKLTTFSTTSNHPNHSESLPVTTNTPVTTSSTTARTLHRAPSNVDVITVVTSPTAPPYQPTPAITSGVDNETKAPKTTESVETTFTSHVTPPSSTSSKPKLSPENIPGYLMLFFKSSFAEVCGTSAALRENLFQYITRRSYRIQSKDQVLMMVDPEQCKEPDNSVRLIPVALYVVNGVGGYDKNLIHELKTLLEEEDLNNYTLPIHEIVYHENIIPDNSRIIAAMVITSIAAISFVLLLFLMCTIRNRQKLNYGQRCTPVSIDDFNLDNISEYNSIRRKSTSRASKRSYGNPTFDDPAAPSKTLTFNGLLKACENRRSLDEEFTQIPVITVKPEELPAGAEVKNRYANVIPLPETRICLSSTNKCSDSVADYINANYVKGYKGADKFYIACQAPLQNTIEDFWKMVWKEQTKVVIMLTGLSENGIEKCADYLPPSEVLDCHRLFGDYQITLKKREVKEKYVISSLQLKNMENNLWREVTHLWYTSWPVQGVPNEQSSIIALLIEARAYMRNSKGPHVVHCSPGTGRTGTVIAIDICIRDYESTRSVNIPSTVARLRRCRAGAVQTKEQYAFIYKVLALYAKKLNGGTTLDSI